MFEGETVFIKKEKASADSYSFYFQKPEGFSFLAGQYCIWTLEVENPDVRGNSRQFTIASSPTEPDLIITTRIVQSSFKKTLLVMPEGTQVKLRGPYGQFVMKEEEANPQVFLAGGIGITPLRAMIKYIADKNLNVPTTLITSFKTADDIVYGAELRVLSKSHSWLKLVETITRPEESKTKWEGLTGRIDADLIKNSLPADATHQALQAGIFYISGPPAMVDALSETVKSLNVPAEHIRIEKFTGY